MRCRLWAKMVIYQIDLFVESKSHTYYFINHIYYFISSLVTLANEIIYLNIRVQTLILFCRRTPKKPNQFMNETRLTTTN